MAVSKKAPAPHPHVRMRQVLGKPEAYVPGTGLSVWEIAWLGRVYSAEPARVANHLDIDIGLVEEALQYAQAHPDEIEPAVRVMEEASEERLRAILPGAKRIDVSLEPDGERAP